MHVGDTLSTEINMKQTKPRSVLMCLPSMIKVYESCNFLFAKETPVFLKDQQPMCACIVSTIINLKGAAFIIGN